MNKYSAKVLQTSDQGRVVVNYPIKKEGYDVVVVGIFVVDEDIHQKKIDELYDGIDNLKSDIDNIYDSESFSDMPQTVKELDQSTSIKFFEIQNGIDSFRLEIEQHIEKVKESIPERVDTQPFFEKIKQIEEKIINTKAPEVVDYSSQIATINIMLESIKKWVTEEIDNIYKEANKIKESFVNVDKKKSQIILPPNRLSNMGDVDLRSTKPQSKSIIKYNAQRKKREAADSAGIADYNDTHTAANPITLAADTWTTITNNGQGSFSNTSHMPHGVDRLMDTDTGQFDFSGLDIGDYVIIRNDYTVTPTTNNSLLELRYVIGNGNGTYTLEKTISRLDSGSGIGYRFSLTPDFIYIGDENTRNYPITLQLRLSTSGTVVNAGSAIGINKR